MHPNDENQRLRRNQQARDAKLQTKENTGPSRTVRQLFSQTANNIKEKQTKNYANGLKRAFKSLKEPEEETAAGWGKCSQVWDRFARVSLAATLRSRGERMSIVITTFSSLIYSPRVKFPVDD